MLQGLGNLDLDHSGLSSPRAGGVHGRPRQLRPSLVSLLARPAINALTFGPEKRLNFYLHCVLFLRWRVMVFGVKPFLLLGRHGSKRVPRWVWI